MVRNYYVWNSTLELSINEDKLELHYFISKKFVSKLFVVINIIKLIKLTWGFSATACQLHSRGGKMEGGSHART